MKISGAHEDHDGNVTALVTFDDGSTQTVRLPNWATRDQFFAEAARLRDLARTQAERHRPRADLNDQ